MKSTALVFAVFASLASGCRRDCPPVPSTTSSPSTTRGPTDTTATTPPPAASPDKLPPGVNAVQNEMRLLQVAMHVTVSAIAHGTLSTIPERLHAVQRARELTEQAVESGTYVLPKNANQLEAFKVLDESFHGELEKLLAAATANDPVATATAFGSVMARCEGCHAQFRGTK